MPRQTADGSPEGDILRVDTKYVNGALPSMWKDSNVSQNMYLPFSSQGVRVF